MEAQLHKAASGTLVAQAARHRTDVATRLFSVPGNHVEIGQLDKQFAALAKTDDA
ncbi:MAG: hypothetical protein R2857_15505 [Vampirovibrionales bacterium]